MGRLNDKVAVIAGSARGEAEARRLVVRDVDGASGDVEDGLGVES